MQTHSPQTATLSPQIATITKIDAPWGAAVGQKVPVRVYVKNNDWKPQRLRIDLKVFDGGKTHYTASQTQTLWGGATSSYRFDFTMPDLPTDTLVWINAFCYQLTLWGPKYAYGSAVYMRVSATPVVMPLSHYTPEILLYEAVTLSQGLNWNNIYALHRKLAPGTYEDAVAEAARIAKEKGIRMAVEGFKPVHLGWSDYKLPVGETSVTLKENVAFYPNGIFSNDPDFDTIKWWSGAKTEYAYDWFTKWVYYKEEKQGTMFPQPVFKGGESFTFLVHSEVPKAKVDAWILGYVVLPATMKEMKITR